MQHKRFLKCSLVMMAVSAMPCLAVTPAALAGRVDARIYPVRDRIECESLNGTWDLQIDDGPWVKAIVPGMVGESADGILGEMNNVVLIAAAAVYETFFGPIKAP